MDDVVNRFARELADAIAAAVAENPQVEACREKARAAGFDMRVTLEAVVGFVSRNNRRALTKVTTPARAAASAQARLEVTANDRRFLRSLRIGPTKTAGSGRIDSQESGFRIAESGIREGRRTMVRRPFVTSARPDSPPRAAAAAAASGSPR